MQLGWVAVEMNNKGLHNPLGIARLCAKLEEKLAAAGYCVELSSDFILLDKIKQELRQAGRLSAIQGTCPLNTKPCWATLPQLTDNNDSALRGTPCQLNQH